MMERQVNHLVRLVDDLLEVSRISRGTFSLRRERVELGHGRAQRGRDQRAADPRRPATSWCVELPDEPVWLEGDPVRLAQILANLLEQRGQVHRGRRPHRAARRREGDQAVVRVRDNGIGIAPEQLPRMFDMFTRGDRDSGRSQGGLGIGLALSRRLAQMHGGDARGAQRRRRQGQRVHRAPAAGSLRGRQARVACDSAEAAGLAGMRACWSSTTTRTPATAWRWCWSCWARDVRVARDGAEALEPFARRTSPRWCCSTSACRA